MTDTRGHAHGRLSRLGGAGDAQWQLVAQAAIGPGATVLEIGVGTGNVLLKVKLAVPTAVAVGLDVSAASLATAARRAARAGVDMQLDLGDAIHLPYADAAVDRVLSSFVFRHLPDDRKLASLTEIRRVLRPGGSLHMLDFLRAESADPTRLMARAGLVDPVQVGEGVSRLGRHAFYQASR